ncbi:MAG: CHRD domain-containing protein [Chloroflexi bacterium]|nr:CHRD domain-containing protein [Chloroflexota bacterium]
MTKRGILASLLAIALLTLSVSPTLGATGFSAVLSGLDEVPPVSSPASGKAIFTLSPDGTTLTYTLSVMNITDAFGAHIHLAPAGANGLVVAVLFSGSAPGTFTGILSEGSLTAMSLTGPLFGMSMDRLVAEINAGNAYVNVHTTAHPGGEIRGQIQILP